MENTAANDDFDDDVDQYMMLVRPFRNKKIPWAPLILAFIAMVLGIISLAIDEISDGDWEIDDSVVYWDSVSEVDFDCGWQELRFTYKWSSQYTNGQTYKYSSSLCSEDQDVFDKDWCKQMKKLGSEWLAFNIMGILFSFASIVVAAKFGQASFVYFILNIAGMASFLSAAAYWLSDEKCNEIEAYSSIDAYTVETKNGASLNLTLAAFGVEVLAVILSTIALFQKRRAVTQGNVTMQRIPSTDK